MIADRAEGTTTDDERSETRGRVPKRHANGGLRKLCPCPRRTWSKCRHSWYLNFKVRGGRSYRLSLDAELNTHIGSKEKAKEAAERIRGEIRAGTFARAAERQKPIVPAPVTTPEAVTLDAFAEIYVERVSKVRQRNKSWTNDKHMLAQLAAFRLESGARLGDKAIGAITEDDLDVFFVSLRKKGRAVSTCNGYVTLVKKAFRWATRRKYIPSNPLIQVQAGDDADNEIKRGKIAKRNRRLAPAVLNDRGQAVRPSEEQRLLAAAAPRLQNLIVAALESCCRRGELLSLQWKDVNLPRGELMIRGEKAKDGDTRVLPISTRLAAVLTMAKTDPAGEAYEPHQFVFGDVG